MAFFVRFVPVERKEWDLQLQLNVPRELLTDSLSMFRLSRHAARDIARSAINGVSQACYSPIEPLGDQIPEVLSSDFKYVHQLMIRH